MEFITLAAHFDGERIQLDEPFELPPNAPLMVTVLQPGVAAEEVSWAVTASMGLSRAYGGDEPEYSIGDVK
jgi:hypothetical protein